MTRSPAAGRASVVSVTGLGHAPDALLVLIFQARPVGRAEPLLERDFWPSAGFGVAALGCVVRLAEGVEHAKDRAAVLLGKRHELPEPPPRAALRGVHAGFGRALLVGAEQFVGGDAERGGEFGHDGKVGVPAAGFVIADGALGAADPLRKLGLSEPTRAAKGDQSCAEDGRGFLLPRHEAQSTGRRLPDHVWLGVHGNS